MKRLLTVSLAGCLMWLHGCHSGGHDDDLQSPWRPSLTMLDVNPGLNGFWIINHIRSVKLEKLSNRMGHIGLKTTSDCSDHDSHSE